MKKIFIEDARVDSFMVDLTKRVCASVRKELGEIDNLVIVGVGESGGQIADRFYAIGGGKLSELARPYLALVQKEGDVYHVLPSMMNERCTLEQFLEDIPTKTAFIVLDGVCRSGGTLTAIYSRLRAVSKRVWTYSVAVSADSSIIPSWYGCLYETNEYVVLVRHGATANTGIFASKEGDLDERLDTPALVLRPPLEGDPEFKTEAPSLQRYKSDDRYFDSTTQARTIRVLEWNSEPVGFVAFQVDGTTLWIDFIVACAEKKKGKQGIGSALYLHVENFAKLRGCKKIDLWAIEKMVYWYEDYGFVKIPNRQIQFGPPENVETYFHMSNDLIGDTGHYSV